MLLKLRCVVISLKRYYLLCLVVSTIMFLLLCCALLHSYNKSKLTLTSYKATLKPVASTNNDIVLTGDVFSNVELRAQMLRRRVERLSRNVRRSRSFDSDFRSSARPDRNVHVFYYAWYGNERTDGAYRHWNHTYLPNWKRDDRKVYPTGEHRPPADVASNFYPKLGCYSSRDPAVVETHLRQIRGAGIGVVVVSWSPPRHRDSPHDVLPTLFETALRYDVKIALHVEPYVGRNPVNLLEHLRAFLERYGDHPALYRMQRPAARKKVPVFYVYDSYLVPDVAWREILSKKGNLSVRNTDMDAVFIGLLVDLSHRSHIKKSQFDGFYTYFASNGFTYGSTWKNWRSLAKFALQNGLLFVPSVGPGYVDTQVRPWNAANTRHRRHGQYYDVAWRTAINVGVRHVSITSFNEWHEGTQIEPAQSRSVLGFTYLDYEPEGPDYYLNLTNWWVRQFEKSVQ